MSIDDGTNSLEHGDKSRLPCPMAFSESDGTPSSCELPKPTCGSGQCMRRPRNKLFPTTKGVPIDDFDSLLHGDIGDNRNIVDLSRDRSDGQQHHLSINHHLAEACHEALSNIAAKWWTCVPMSEAS